MSELRLLADIEKLVIQHLLTYSELEDLVGDRIGSKKDGPYPRLTITRLGGSPTPQPAHLDSARIQVEAWGDHAKDGGGKGQANLVARTAQAAMHDMVNVSHEEGVVTDVQCILGPSWVPDQLTDRPRYLLDFIVRVHPIAVS